MKNLIVLILAMVLILAQYNCNASSSKDDESKKNAKDQTESTTDSSDTSTTQPESEQDEPIKKEYKFPDPPETKQEIVSETIHGAKIDDPYIWLEDDESQEVKEWTDKQNQYTQNVLSQFDGRNKIKEKITDLMQIDDLGTPHIRGDKIIYGKRVGDQDQPVYYVRRGVDGDDVLLLDVNTLSEDGTTALDWLSLSNDGKYMAYGTSEGGSEQSTLYIIDIDTKEILADQIKTGRSSSIGWLPDSSGFYYIKYPEKGEVPEGDENYYRSIFFHKIGDDPANDEMLFRPSPEKKELWTNINISLDGKWLIVTLNEGWSFSEMYLVDLTKDTFEMKTISKEIKANFGGWVMHDTLYIYTNWEAPFYRLLKVDAKNPAMENWQELIPESKNRAVLNGVVPIQDKLIAKYLEKAHSKVYIFNNDGTGKKEIKLKGLGSVRGINAELDSEYFFYDFESFGIPKEIYTYNIKTNEQKLWDKIDVTGIDPSTVVTKQVEYKSKDGTPITMFLIYKKGIEQTADNPTVLWGYGGFNVSLAPVFSTRVFFWIDNGGVYAIPNLRGGGEYGEEWHQAGMKEKKQNVFDDFIAAAEWLIDNKYTNSDRLAVAGGSNGGLLTGAFIVQRPDLCKAALVLVPLLDMVRYHKFEIARLWIPEYGSAENEKEFKYLYEYSPYHNVKEGTEYPATLLTTGLGDTRVESLHAMKMAALLQHAQGGELPILLRVEEKAGHGQGKPLSMRIDEYVDWWTFVFMMLDVTPKD